MARSMADLIGDDTEDDEDSNSVSEKVETDWAKLRAGVTVHWLRGLTGYDIKTIKKRLAPLRPKGKVKSYDVYDVVEAMSYLVKPKFDIKDYMKTMNPTELPPMLRKEYWDAENKRATFMERAGDLWHTSSIIELLAEIGKIIKTSTQVWADDVERKAGLTPEQYKALISRVDVLRDDLYDRLTELSRSGKLRAHLEDFDAEDRKTDA